MGDRLGTRFVTSIERRCCRNQDAQVGQNTIARGAQNTRSGVGNAPPVTPAYFFLRSRLISQ